MDGYAIRWADRAGPWRVTGEAAAGHGFSGTIGSGDAVRISTGAPLPDGADTVVVQEDVERCGATLKLTGDGPPGQGAHIRIAGLDFSAGDVIARAGSVLTPARLGLLAAAGHGSALVHRRPRVVILATGDELVAPGEIPGADRIVSSSGVMLAALLAGEANVIDGGIVPDRRDALEAAVRNAAGADLLVTIGGASVGDHDLIVPVLTAMGADIDFWKIALRPGKPMLSGMLGELRVVGLPGNPVSAFVCAHLFVRPLLRQLAGDPAPLPRLHEARLASPLPANNARQDYLRATIENSIDGPLARAAERQESSMLRTLADCNALIVRAPGAPPASVGEMILYHALDFVPGVA
jgi:molybdopterin molybdotransferase